MSGYEAQFRESFQLLCGSNHLGMQFQEFHDILQNLPNAPSTEDVDAAFKRHTDDGKHISCDCMVEATAECQNSSNFSFATMNLVQSIERMQWKKLFELVDEDGGGTIDPNELRSFVDALATVMNLKHYTQQEATRTFKEEGKEEIDFETFITIARRMTKGINVITIVDKVEEAKKAVKERKASALNMFQNRILHGMLRRQRMSMVKGQAPILAPDVVAAAEKNMGISSSGNQHVDPNNKEPSPPPPYPEDDASITASRSRRRSPDNTHIIVAGADEAENNVQQYLHPSYGGENDTVNNMNDFFRCIQPDPSSGEQAPQNNLPPFALGRVQAAVHFSNSNRVLGILDQLCSESADPAKIASQVAHMCAKIEDAVNGPSGTMLEMQRAAVSRTMQTATDFLQKLKPAPSMNSPTRGFSGARNADGIPVPRLDLSPSSGGGEGGVGGSRHASVISAGGSRTRSRRAQTIIDTNFGKDLLCDIALEKLEIIQEARREVGSVQEDSEYAINQIVLPRNKIVELAMTLIPHARSSTALAKAIRNFERQTRDLFDCIAYFKFFADTSNVKNRSMLFGSSSHAQGSSSEDLTSASSNEKSSSNPNVAPLSVLEVMRQVESEKWGEYAPPDVPDRTAELVDAATLHVAWVGDMMKDSPTIWIKDLAAVCAELAHQVKALASSFLRDRAVQTPTELLVGLQSFPVNFSLSGNNPHPGAISTEEGGDAAANAASAREKRRLALAHARIRRSLVADVTRAAESVDLLIRRYLTAGVIVPPNFGRLIVTDPEKKKRHTFRFGSRLVDLTPLDDRLAVHNCGGYMYFDEYCGKYTELETLRLKREEKRHPHQHISTVSVVNPYTSPSRSGSAATVEVSVRSGSPVQILPFPGVAELNERSVSAIREHERSSNMGTQTSVGAGGEGRSASEFSIGTTPPALTRPRR